VHIFYKINIVVGAKNLIRPISLEIEMAFVQIVAKWPWLELIKNILLKNVLERYLKTAGRILAR